MASFIRTRGSAGRDDDESLRDDAERTCAAHATGGCVGWGGGCGVERRVRGGEASQGRPPTPSVMRRTAYAARRISVGMRVFSVIVLDPVEHRRNMRTAFPTTTLDNSTHVRA